MILSVRVIPRAKSNRIQELGADNFKIHITAPAEDNKANQALIELLAGHFKVRRNQVLIVRGEKSRNKTVEIRRG